MGRGARQGFGPHGGRLARAAAHARSLVRAEDLVAEVRATFADDYAPRFAEEGWRAGGWGGEGFVHPDHGSVRRGGFYPYGHLYIHCWLAEPKTDRGVRGPLHPLGPFPTPEEAASFLTRNRRLVQYGDSVMYPAHRWEKADPLVWRIHDRHTRTDREHHLRHWRVPAGGEVAEWGGRFIARRPGMPWLGPFHGAAVVEHFLADVAERVRLARWWRPDPASGDPRHPETHAVASAPELLR